MWRARLRQRPSLLSWAARAMSNVGPMFAYRGQGLRDWLPKRRSPCPKAAKGLRCTKKTPTPPLGVAAGRQVLVRDRGRAGRAAERRTGRDRSRTTHPDNVVVGVGIGSQTQGLGADGSGIRLVAVGHSDGAAVAGYAGHVLTRRGHETGSGQLGCRREGAPLGIELRHGGLPTLGPS